MSPVFILKVANLFLINHLKRKPLVDAFGHIAFLADKKNEAV